MGTGWAAVRVRYKYSNANPISVKFKFSRAGCFGIGLTKYPKGLPGRDDCRGWMWSTSGQRFMHSKGVAC